MVNKTEITRNLKELNARFQRPSRNPRDPLYYSKLAILETCGWIETTMDDIVSTCANKYMKNASNVKYLDDRIRGNANLHYDRNFRRILIEAIGLINVERLEVIVDQAKFDSMKSALGTLVTRRNEAAHTYIKNATIQIDSPAVTTAYFLRVYEGLKDIERSLRRLSI